MSFKTPSIAPTMPLRPKSKQHDLLRADLAELKRQIADAEVRLEALPIDTKEEERLRASIEELLKEMDEVSQALALAQLDRKDTKTAHEGEKEELEVTRRKHGDLLVAHTQLLKEHETLKATHGTLKTRHGELQRQSEALESTVRSKATEEVKRIASLTEEARGELATIKGSIAAAQKELAGLAQDRLAAKALRSKIALARGDLDNVLTQIKVQERALRTLNESVSVAEQERQEALATEEKAAAKRKEELDAREQDLERREGEVNFSVGALKKKAGLLRQAKQELEDFHGKQLRHIRIPDEADIG